MAHSPVVRRAIEGEGVIHIGREDFGKGADQAGTSGQLEAVAKPRVAAEAGGGDERAYFFGT